VVRKVETEVEGIVEESVNLNRALRGRPSLFLMSRRPHSSSAQWVELTP